MSLSQIISSAKSGLSAAQAGMQTVSNNIANVNVAGYARQTTNLSTGVVSGQVSGVIVGEPSRVADKFLESAVYTRAGTAGAAETRADYLDRLQTLLGTTDSSTSLLSQLTSITTAVSEISGLQSTSASISEFTGNIADTLQTLTSLQDDVASLQGEADSEVSETVDSINTLLVKINALNSEVARLQGLGMSTSGPADERMSALEELSGLVNLTVREQDDGKVYLETDGGQVLLDNKLRQLSYSGGSGIAQPTYSDIEIVFADADGTPGVSTGQVIDANTVGGTLSGLLDARDRILPEFSEQLGQVFTGLANSLNAASNNGTTLPPPQTLTGEANGLIGTDRLGFTGAATFAVLTSDGTLVNSVTVDFDALGTGATVDDAIAAINAGLGGDATASFTDGVLSITATSSANGIAIAQDEDNPSDRAGSGFSQFFGLNNIVRSDSSALVDSGFVASDAHGFTAGETASLTLRSSTGKTLATFTLDTSTGTTWGDLVDSLNAGDLGAYGTFALDDSGRIAFTPSTGYAGATISIPSDSTDRYGTGLSFSALSGLTGNASGLATASVDATMLADTTAVPFAQLNLDAAIGENAIGSGDLRNATTFIDALTGLADFGKDGSATIESFATSLFGSIGTEASRAASTAEDATARLTDAVSRRDSYSGVNIDEELAQMVILQNSYSASARVMTTASDMYDALIAMVS
ncbi:flagellar biosynthesis protein FlgK [Novosphingobium profundi]|uniref:flagellar hook-associated protein FlgK n=1 Tax=Novosphingobium profundi TaxID=1774954 RepID=UPI001BD912ED|nr:flagellar biosynthesis protein FlgK [Novosphingobium profundi]